MKSAIYLIGQDLTVESFSAVVEPYMNAREIVVTNKQAVKLNHNQVLVALKGECSEQSLDMFLMELGEKFHQDNTISPRLHRDTISQACRRGKDEAGVFTTLGVYDAEETAAKVFPYYAQEYAAHQSRLSIERSMKTISELLDQKVRSL